MLTTLSEMLKKQSKGWLILLLFALVLLFAIVIVPLVQGQLEARSGGAGPIDLLFSYTPEEAYSIIASFGDEGRAIYRTFAMTGDIIYPVIYSMFFSLIMTWLFQRGFAPNSKMHLLNVIPLGAWLFDWLENIHIVTMLSLYPSTSTIVAKLASFCTTIKWSFGAVATVLVLFGFVMALKNGFKKPS